jgi:hypothetical protein
MKGDRDLQVDKMLNCILLTVDDLPITQCLTSLDYLDQCILNRRKLFRLQIEETKIEYILII